MQARHSERPPVKGKQMAILRRLAVRRRRRDELGATAILVALLFSFVALPLGAVSVDLSRLYAELARVQAAADAAATAGVTFMPDNFADAKARALDVARTNGYPNSGSTSVLVEVGEKPTQLKVTVSSTIDNTFGKAIGVPDSTMKAYAVADFNGPAPMGSPCNVFGNEPKGSQQLPPTSTTLKVPPYADCANPEFWGAITGPETVKGQGAQFETRKCKGDEDGCASGTGGANEEFDPRGFIYMVRVNESGVGSPVQLQIYDPAYVETSSECHYGPVAETTSGSYDYTSYGNISSGDNHRYPLATTDANQRYDNDNDANMFCSGDSDNAGNRFGSEVPTITSFALRAPIDNLNPYQAPAHNVAQCTKQFPGYSARVNAYSGERYRHLSGPRERNLRNSGSNDDYEAPLARVFHQWVNFCTFTPDRAGDWYIQVRNNVALPSGYTLDSTGAVAGNPRVTTQTGDDVNVLGNGTNQFAFRAISSAPAGSVSVAPWERMRIYANAASATTEFNLVRVAPAAANKTLVVTFFDVGEGADSGTVTILRPNDSNLPSSLQDCVGSGVKDGDLSNCRITGISSSNYNGKLQEIRIPIPNTYTCQVASQGGCWFRARVSFGSGDVHDATTWTARIVGEPVRLIE